MVACSSGKLAEDGVAALDWQSDHRNSSNDVLAIQANRVAAAVCSAPPVWYDCRVILAQVPTTLMERDADAA